MPESSPTVAVVDGDRVVVDRGDREVRVSESGQRRPSVTVNVTVRSSVDGLSDVFAYVTSRSAAW